MTATLLSTGDEHRQRRAHIEAYVGEVGEVRVRRAADGTWHHDIACKQCLLRWWKDGADAGELIAAWLIHEAGHGAEYRRQMARWARGQQLRGGEPLTRGISHLVALALTIMDLDVVRRSTIRALLPEDGNRVQGQAGRAFRNFEKVGWVTRLEPDLVQVNDAESLFGWVTNSRDLNPERALTMLRVGVAAKTAAAEAAHSSPLLDEVRRRELLALQRLMERAPGVTTNKRGTVRVVPKSRTM